MMCRVLQLPHQFRIARQDMANRLGRITTSNDSLVFLHQVDDWANLGKSAAWTAWQTAWLWLSVIGW
jgi:hypothetical protein